MKIMIMGNPKNLIKDEPAENSENIKFLLEKRKSDIDHIL
jgi:hypothetical protein